MVRSPICIRFYMIQYIQISAFILCHFQLLISPLHSLLQSGVPVLFSIYGSNFLWSYLSLGYILAAPLVTWGVLKKYCYLRFWYKWSAMWPGNWDFFLNPQVIQSAAKAAEHWYKLLVVIEAKDLQELLPLVVRVLPAHSSLARGFNSSSYFHSLCLITGFDFSLNLLSNPLISQS